MGNLIFMVIGYIFLRFVIFYAMLFLIDKNMKLLKSSDLESGEDWLYFLWLFFVPTAIEAILLSFPFSFGLRKIYISHNKLFFYFLFIALFIVEFILSNWLYGTQSAVIKIIISLLLFLLLFRKRLF